MKRKYKKRRVVISNPLMETPPPKPKSRIDAIVPTEYGPVLFHVVMGDGREQITLDLPSAMMSNLLDRASRNAAGIAAWLEGKIAQLDAEKPKRRSPSKRGKRRSKRRKS